MVECNHDHHSHDLSDQGMAKLKRVLLLVLVYFLAELIGGFWTGSLALLADAGHMFSDMAAISISLYAARLTARQGTDRMTFGYHRAEVLASLINGNLLIFVAGGIIHEAWDRFSSPTDILVGPMFAIAVGGLLINLISLKVLHGNHNDSLNMRGAWLHVLGDTLGSVGVIIAAALAWQFGWVWADPIASIVVCLFITYSAWGLIREAVNVLMERAPNDINVDSVRTELQSNPGVVDVHCLHVWTIGRNIRSMSAHIVIESEDTQNDLVTLHQRLKERFSLEHVTLQIELPLTACSIPDSHDCMGIPHEPAKVS